MRRPPSIQTPALTGKGAGASGLQPVIQPGARHAPVAIHGWLRDAQYSGNFGILQAAEVSQFHKFCLPFIKLRQFFQGLVEIDEVDGVGLGGFDLNRHVQFYMRAALPALDSGLPSGKIDQNLPHQSGGECEEVRAILPFDWRIAHQPEERFVDKRGRL